jgi:UDP-2,4-diacetamido-2,4,6-trideoxy-beta-L-altropyranose hydrolase
MHVVFRVDSSIEIGTGHFMRCMTLADELVRRGAGVSFICRDFPGNLCDITEDKCYPVHRLTGGEVPVESCQRQRRYEKWLGVDWKTDVKQTKEFLAQENRETDWLIVDHYAIDKRWETAMRSSVSSIMVIDDLADRPHDCDLLLDQNYCSDLESRYVGQIPINCRRLLGPVYALLRPEFRTLRTALNERQGDVKRMLVFFGGCDPTNETIKALEAIKLFKHPEIAVDVVIGINNPHRAFIKALAATMPQTACHSYVTCMADLMVNADLYIGAAGTTTWERCCLGLPSMVITVAQNQVEATRAMADHKLLCFVGESDRITERDILKCLMDLCTNNMLLRHYSEASRKLVDGMGAKRCASALASS